MDWRGVGAGWPLACFSMKSSAARYMLSFWSNACFFSAWAFASSNFARRVAFAFRCLAPDRLRFLDLVGESPARSS